MTSLNLLVTMCSRRVSFAADISLCTLRTQTLHQYRANLGLFSTFELTESLFLAVVPDCPHLQTVRFSSSNHQLADRLHVLLAAGTGLPSLQALACPLCWHQPADRVYSQLQAPACSLCRHQPADRVLLDCRHRPTPSAGTSLHADRVLLNC